MAKAKPNVGSNPQSTAGVSQRLPQEYLAWCKLEGKLPRLRRSRLQYVAYLDGLGFDVDWTRRPMWVSRAI
jgi:hypothetical protein